MQKILLSLTSLCIFFLNIQAQDSYFYNADAEKIQIIEKSSSLCIFLHKETIGQNLKVIKHPGLKSLRGDPQRAKSRFIFDFDQDYAESPIKMAEKLGFDLREVRSAHWGVELESGMEMWLTHQVLFELKAGAEISEIEGIWAEYSGAKLGESRVGLKHVEIHDIQATLPLANQLFESGLVNWAQPNFAAVVVAQGIDTGTPVYPTDSLWGKQLNLHNTGQRPMDDQPTPFWKAGITDWDINAPEAWCITKGSSNIKVAIIDAGFEPHEDLNDDNGGGGSRITGTYTPNPSFVQGGVPQPGLPQDEKAHGQAVAGIIGASHNSIGVAGICPECQLFAICAYADVNGLSLSDPTEIGYMADAISWSWMNGADVINNSWVFNTCTATALFAPVEAAITAAKTSGRGGKGSVVVFSTGQTIGGSYPYDCVGYPANLSNVIAAGAIDYRGDFPGYANYGPELDIVAVTSRQDGQGEHQSQITVIDRESPTIGYNRVDNQASTLNYLNKKYTRYFGGTSVAAAEVSGVAALVLSKNPDLTAAEVTNLLLSNTRTSGIGGVPNQSGNGLLRADLVLTATPSPGLPVEYLSFTGEAKTQRIELSWETALELNNDYFLVEKQIKGVFRPIGRVEGTGNSNQTKAYGFEDLAPDFGSNFYRLRQVDYDGTLDYSHSIEVSMDASNLGMITRMFPNPALNELNLEVFDMAREEVLVQILDFRGRTLVRKEFNISQESEILNLDVSSLSAGAYMIRIIANGAKQEIRKFVKAE